jgi:hypothetical protein
MTLRSPRKRVKGQPFRGFKSHLHRQRAEPGASGRTRGVCGAVTVIRKKERAGLPESPLPEPQSTTFFVFLIVVFGGLMWWLAVAKQTVFRILAACLAFIPAMMFGVAAVNKYYDYYQNWNSAIADLTGQNAATAVVPAGEVGTGVKIGTFLGSKVNTSLAASEGLTVRLSVPGRASHITRTVYVYLPPQYFQRSFRNYRFPAGSPWWASPPRCRTSSAQAPRNPSCSSCRTRTAGARSRCSA